jgi:hypothetical protein
VADDILPAVAAGHHVIDRIGVLDAQAACHPLIAAESPADPGQ